MLANREKKESELVKAYYSIIQLIQQKKQQEGVQQLKQLLEEKLIQEEQFQNLRYACYVSLGETYDKDLKLYNDSIHFFYKAIKIKPTFKVWFRLGELCRIQGYLPQSEQCFFQALNFKPSDIFENLIYQNLTAVSFLQEQWSVCLKRIDCLINKQFNIEDHLALKQYIFQRLG